MQYARKPPLLLPLPAAGAVFLGLAAVIAGILGMHMLSASHHEPATAVAAFPAHSADQSPHPANQSPHPGEQPASYGSDAGPCSQDHDSTHGVCTLMIFVLILLLIPKVLSRRLRRSLALRRGRPGPLPVPRPPSLVRLCISRT